MPPTLDAISQAIQAKIEALRAPLTIRQWQFKIGAAARAASPKYDDSRWQTISLMHTWSSLDGEAWFRASVALPDEVAGIPPGRLPAGAGYLPADRRRGLCQRQRTLPRAIVGRHARRAAAAGREARPRRAACAGGALQRGRRLRPIRLRQPARERHRADSVRPGHRARPIDVYAFPRRKSREAAGLGAGRRGAESGCAGGERLGGVAGQRRRGDGGARAVRRGSQSATPLTWSRTATST